MITCRQGTAPYFSYFGANAGPAGQGYYGYGLGGWRIYSLNSEIAAGAGSTQEQWLRAELASNPRACVLAYWHKPVFSSGDHGNDPTMRDIWKTLYDSGADVVLAGHDHNYKRFGLQNVNGVADPQRGIREFVVAPAERPCGHSSRFRPNSEARDAVTHGVLKVTLHPTSYSWEFLPPVEPSRTPAAPTVWTVARHLRCDVNRDGHDYLDHDSDFDPHRNRDSAGGLAQLADPGSSITPARATMPAGIWSGSSQANDKCKELEPARWGEKSGPGR